MSLEFDEYVATTIEDDSVIQSYMGGTIDDSRLYPWNPPFDPTFSSTYPGALFFMSDQYERPDEYFSYPSQKGDIVFRFQVVANDKTLVRQITDQLVLLFEDIPITTDSWRALDVKVTGNLEGDQTGTPTNPLYTRLISFRFSTILKRSDTSP